MSAGAKPRRAPVSIVCVFNDPEIRRGCLDRSIEEHLRDGEIEYVPVDNVEGRFPTAGAALNHGASLARHEYLVFAHQDVYLHSTAALPTAAGVLAADGGIGLLGATGVTTSGKLLGRIRDRVVLTGEPAPRAREVDSLDEVLFMVPRRLFRRHPLSEARELGWHAYAVEYGLRVRSLGRRVCALDLPLTHNSPTVNNDRLDVAYRAVAVTHPEELPVRTTCGVVSAPSRSRRGGGLLRSHRWRYRWLRESAAVHAVRRMVGGGRCVLGDIRFEIDEVLAAYPGSPLSVANLDREPGPATARPGPVELERRGRPIRFASRSLPELIGELVAQPAGNSMLLTNLRVADLRALCPYLPPGPRLLGYRREIGFWLLLGAAAVARPQEWRSPKARPLRMPAPA
jgi:Glycosyltransferase like family